MTEPSLSKVSNGRILVVDDDQSTCDVLTVILEQQGFSVNSVNSGEKAIALFGEFLFDVVFTDIIMDGISGLELLNRITRLDSTIKTIVMTAHSGYDSALSALKGGAYDYIEKPLSDHARVAAIAVKAYQHSVVERDNAQLLIKLKPATANWPALMCSLLNSTKT